MSKAHLSIKTTFGHPKGGRIRQVSLYTDISIAIIVSVTVLYQHSSDIITYPHFPRGLLCVYTYMYIMY